MAGGATRRDLYRFPEALALDERDQNVLGGTSCLRKGSRTPAITNKADEESNGRTFAEDKKKCTDVTVRFGKSDLGYKPYDDLKAVDPTAVREASKKLEGQKLWNTLRKLYVKYGIRWTRSKDQQDKNKSDLTYTCLLYTSPSPRDGLLSRMPSSA